MRPISTDKASKKVPIIVRASPLDRRRGILQFGPLRLQAALGRSGITSFKREGDGATPLAQMRLMSGYVRADRRRPIVSALPMRMILRDALWCDAPDHPAYNRPVRAPFAASHEHMWRDDGLYDICLVLDWNVTERKRGKGSAIFMHMGRPGYMPTEGCIALSPRDMARLLPHLRRQTAILVRR